MTALRPIVVSYSELDAFRQCPHKHDLSHRQGWTPNTVGPALTKGRLWHLVLETHYLAIQSGSTSMQRRQAISDLLVESVDDYGIETCELIAWMYDGHEDRWGVDGPDDEYNWRVVSVEDQRLCRLPTPSGRGSRYYLRMRIDLMIQQLTVEVAGHRMNASMDPESKRFGKLYLVDHKCLGVDMPVATYQGVLLAGKLSEGDLVWGNSGWTPVTAITRRRRGIVRLTLKNGKTLEASGEHQWPVIHRRSGTAWEGPGSKRELWTTLQIAEGVTKGETIALVAASAQEFPEQHYPIDPYLLGALLGDGSFQRNPARYWKGTPEVAARALQSVNSREMSVDERSHVPGWYVDFPPGTTEKLGLAGVHGRAKFIPEPYLRGTGQQRRDLLAGLLDADGSHRKGVPLYQTQSRQLAWDIQQLVESLGGQAILWCNQAPKYHYQGTIRVGQPNWEVKIRLPSEFGCPFGYHPGKISRWKSPTAKLHGLLQVVSTESLGPRSCVDIEVQAGDALFATSGVMTHNSGKDLPTNKELDIDDQFGLYTWGCRQLGAPVFGAYYNAARTYQHKEERPLEERFSRTRLYRTDRELDTIAHEAFLTARTAYNYESGDAPRAPDTDRCFPAGTLVQAAGVERAYRRWYEGRLIKIKTASGNEFSGTPNHPILTSKGWVALGLLKQGDSLVRYYWKQNATRGSGVGPPNIQDDPIPIEQVAETLLPMNSGQRMPGGPLDFHGDGRHGDVEIVTAHSHLLNHVHSFKGEPARNHIFTGPVDSDNLLCLGHFQTDKLISLHTPAYGNVQSPQMLSYLEARNTQALTQTVSRLPSLVSDNHGLYIKGVDALSPSGGNSTIPVHARVIEYPIERVVMSNPEFFHQALDGFSTQVSADEIIVTESIPWAGHVYNLQTESGWYTAGSIAHGAIVRNCRWRCPFTEPCLHGRKTSPEQEAIFLGAGGFTRLNEDERLALRGYIDPQMPSGAV